VLNKQYGADWIKRFLDCVLSYSSSHGYSLLAKQVGLTISGITACASAAAKRAQASEAVGWKPLLGSVVHIKACF